MKILIHQPQKATQFLKDSHKRQLTSHPPITKDKKYFYNFFIILHTVLICVLCPKIAFILGREVNKQLQYRIRPPVLFVYTIPFILNQPWSRSNGRASALEPRVRLNLGARERSLGKPRSFGRLAFPLDARRCRGKLENDSHFGGHFRPPTDQ